MNKLIFSRVFTAQIVATKLFSMVEYFASATHGILDTYEIGTSLAIHRCDKNVTKKLAAEVSRINSTNLLYM